LNQDDALVAVVERRAGARFDRRVMIDALTLRLENPAVPKIIHLIEQMPRNENGKIDRRAVAAWLDSAEAERADMV